MSPAFEAEVRAPRAKTSRRVPMTVVQPTADEARILFQSLDPQGSDDTPLDHYRLNQVSR